MIKRPLDPDATRSANAAVALQTGGRPLTMGPKDAVHRRNWARAYEKALADKYTQSNSSPVASASPSATSSSATKPVGSPVEPCPLKRRQITAVVAKRKQIKWNAKEGEDKYGHWWLEIDETESYGWWPAEQVGAWSTVKGVDGELNGQSIFGGTATTDPHHGDPADETFSPWVEAGDCRTDDEIKQCLRDYAKDYSGSWAWRPGDFGQNCHSFQTGALEHCSLSEK
jgi:hypothetical protein